MEGLYSIVSRIGNVLWAFIKMLLKPLFIIASFAVGVFTFIGGTVSSLVTQIHAVWSVLTGAGDNAHAAMAAGWPASFAPAVNFANQWVPLLELFVSIVVLLIVWCGCVLTRITKSLIPLFNT